ncbi:MAG: 2-hydroxyacid dehydrogenase [Rhizobiales bacterium]|nr:2-hydroxyacid dehydrogenase [Hyphomicrobiales bacterium]MDQ3559575.1 2-hydroxyacid dehydrogenase [Pseudomonadota bacterium]
MKPDVLVLGELAPHVMAALDETYALHRLHAALDRQAFLRDIGDKVRGIATSNFFGAPADLIDALPNLEIISSIGVGTESHAVDHARRRGVRVANTPDVLNDDVANLAVALLLAATRRIVSYDRYVRDGRWTRDGDPPLTRGIAGRRIGIVGLGRIGMTIAEKLKVFGCDIAYFARHQRSDAPYPYHPDLADLARASAALIVIVPGGAGTEKLIDARVLDALGPEGILVNVARGSVVDEPALVAALREGRLGGAALDVFADEPNVPEALFAMDNVILQPHQGSATVETRRAMSDLMLANLAAHFDGRPLISPLF